MTIELFDYRLEQEPNAPTKFNLTQKRAKGKGSKTPDAVYWETLAYGVSIQHAIELIASYEMLKRDDVVTLGAYVTEFKNALAKFDELLKHQP